MEENRKRWLFATWGTAVGMLIMFLLLGGGCCSNKLINEAVRSEQRSKTFVKLMDSGETTREQEQEWIRVCDKMFTAIRMATGEEPMEAE